MSQTSYPITGVNISHATWRSLYRGPFTGGIVDDTTGTAGALTIPASGDNVTIAPVKFDINGFIGEVTANHSLFLAPIASGSPVTYEMGFLYDPAKEGDQLANSDSQDGPINLEVHASGTLSVPTGGSWWVLYKLTRSVGATLAQSAGSKVDLRRWMGPHYHATNAGADIAPNLPSTAPRGSTADVDGVSWSRQMVGSTLKWVNLDVPDWAALPIAGYAGQLVAGPTGRVPQYGRARGRVYLWGSVQRANGDPLVPKNVNTNIGTLPTAFRPPHDHQFVVGASMGVGVAQTCRVNVGHDGIVSAFNQESDVQWIDLSAVAFYPQET